MEPRIVHLDTGCSSHCADVLLSMTLDVALIISAATLRQPAGLMRVVGTSPFWLNSIDVVQSRPMLWPSVSCCQQTHSCCYRRQSGLDAGNLKEDDESVIIEATCLVRSKLEEER